MQGYVAWVSYRPEALHVTSVKALKEGALTPTSGLTSSFLHAPLGWLIGWSLTALSTQFKSYCTFKVELHRVPKKGRHQTHGRNSVIS